MRRAAQRDLVKFKKSRSFVNFSHIDFFFSLEFLKSTMVSIVLIISSLIGIAYFQIESFSIEELEKNNHNFLFQMILSLSVCLQWTFFLCLNYYMFGKFYYSKLNLNLSETILMSPLTSIGQILLINYKSDIITDIRKKNYFYIFNKEYPFVTSGKYYYENLCTWDFYFIILISSSYFILYIYQIYFSNIYFLVLKIQEKSKTDSNFQTKKEVLISNSVFDRIFNKKYKGLSLELIIKCNPSNVILIYYFVNLIGLSLFMFTIVLMFNNELTIPKDICFVLIFKGFYFLTNWIKLDVLLKYRLILMDFYNQTNEIYERKKEIWKLIMIASQHSFNCIFSLIFFILSIIKGSLFFFSVFGLSFIGSLFMLCVRIKKYNRYECYKEKLDKSFIFEEVVNEEHSCAICHELLKNKRKIKPCGHHFHLICLKQWVKKNHNCPLCRASIENHKDLNINKKGLYNFEINLSDSLFEFLPTFNINIRREIRATDI